MLDDDGNVVYDANHGNKDYNDEAMAFTGSEENVTIERGTATRKYAGLESIDVDEGNMVVETPEEVREIIDGTSEMIAKEFPIIDEFNYRVLYGETDSENPAAMMCFFDGNTPGMVVALDRNLWKDKKSISDFWETHNGTSHVKTNGPGAIIAHEYGHLIFEMVAMRKTGYPGFGEMTDRQILQYVNAKRIMINAVDSLSRQYPSLSQRAGDNVDEVIAEAFADYFFGTKVHDFSRAVLSLLR